MHSVMANVQDSHSTQADQAGSKRDLDVPDKRRKNRQNNHRETQRRKQESAIQFLSSLRDW